jgi:hypothetical protein
MKVAVTFWYDEINGCLEAVKLGEEFRTENGLKQIDVMKDIAVASASLYKQGVMQIFEAKDGKVSACLQAMAEPVNFKWPV